MTEKEHLEEVLKGLSANLRTLTEQRNLLVTRAFELAVNVHACPAEPSSGAGNASATDARRPVGRASSAGASSTMSSAPAGNAGPPNEHARPAAGRSAASRTPALHASPPSVNAPAAD